MSILVTALAWKNGPQKSNHLLMMLALADFADDEGGNIWPSVATLSEKCRIKPRQCHTILSELEAEGWIERRSGKANGKSNNYKIGYAKIAHPPQQGCVVDRRPPTQRSAEGSAVDCIQTVNKHQVTVIDKDTASAVSKESAFSVLSGVAGDEAATSFVAYRKTLKAPLTVNAAKLLRKQLEEASARGHDPAECLAYAELKGWRGFKANWMENAERDRTDGKPGQTGADIARDVAQLYDQERVAGGYGIAGMDSGQSSNAPGALLPARHAAGCDRDGFARLGGSAGPVFSAGD